MNLSDDLASVRSAYDTVAESYSKVLPDASIETPLDRAMINAFIEYVTTAGEGSVLDAGCGAGRMAGFIAAEGTPVSGIDLSPAMIGIARREYPDLAFDVAELSDLPAKDAQFGGVLAWYSIIHTAPDDLPRVFAEFLRVLAPEGFLLLGFQVGDGPRHMANAYGHDISLDAHLFTPEYITGLLAQAGFDVVAQMVRAPGELERTRQAMLLAQKRK
jgi:ubiquinone/menaquinone biosynthesis C-methylase UbiE